MSSEPLGCATSSFVRIAPGEDVPVAEALAGDATAVLDAWQNTGVHEQWTALKKLWRITWPCPCRKCSPKPPRIVVSPTGPTAFEVEAVVFTARLRGVYLSPEKAREQLLDGGSDAVDAGVLDAPDEVSAR